jgi:hypothetical protein
MRAARTAINAADLEFLDAFERRAVGAGDFHHADHVRLAWIYLRHYGGIGALERFTAALRRFAAHNGAPGRYHETITWAYLFLLRERMERDEPRDWQSFRATHRDLLQWRPSILERYYTPETLGSELARKAFVMPDAGIVSPTCSPPASGD